jgi:cell division protein FtsB
MKKFIVVVISLLFLTVFLMMNYLIWDKDNLLAQQQDNKNQQDWLRGQNSALSDTITELEDAVKILERDKANLNEQNNSLQRQVISATGREATLRRTLDTRTQSLDALKTAALPQLRTLLSDWMTAVSESRLEDSLLVFTPDYLFFQKSLTPERYGDMVSATVVSVSYYRAPQTETDEDVPPPVAMFERVGNESQDLQVLVRTQVIAELKPEVETVIPYLKDGMNTLAVQFLYDAINQKWYIQSITIGS